MEQRDSRALADDEMFRTPASLAVPEDDVPSTKVLRRGVSRRVLLVLPEEELRRATRRALFSCASCRVIAPVQTCRGSTTTDRVLPAGRGSRQSAVSRRVS